MPAMKDALDEVALEWRTTRSAVMRELIAHALQANTLLTAFAFVGMVMWLSAADV